MDEPFTSPTVKKPRLAPFEAEIEAERIVADSLIYDGRAYTEEV